MEFKSFIFFFIRNKIISSAYNLPNEDAVENNTVFDLTYIGFTTQCLCKKKKMISRCHEEQKYTWNILTISKEITYATTKTKHTDVVMCVSVITCVLHWILTAWPCLLVLGAITKFMLVYIEVFHLSLKHGLLPSALGLFVCFRDRAQQKMT